MVFTETRIQGMWIVDVTAIPDSRGLFAMTWLPEEFRVRGLDPSLAQCNLAFNHKRGTLRGLHFQRAPHEQVKIIRCTRGALLDVVVDLRKGSPTYCQSETVELTADNRRMLYIPAGLAHGYLTLEDATEAYYHASTPWSRSHEDGVRWDDPVFGVRLPFQPVVISEKDRNWPFIAR